MIKQTTRLFNRRHLLTLLALLLGGGFVATSLTAYLVSRQAIRSALVEQDLPLTSSNIYSEIQRDLIRPVLISSTMAHDTFVRNWVLGGEQGAEEMAAYLREIRLRYGAFSSFFVSERTANYYTADGLLKKVHLDEPRDAWYYRVRGMQEDHEINVDPDLANRDALTIFINYRVFDFDRRFIGATGVGMTVDALSRLVDDYQKRFERTIYFVDAAGRVVLAGGAARDLHQDAGLAPLLPRIFREQRGSFQFDRGGERFVLHVNYLPELKWHLFVEQSEDRALASVRQTLYVNLAISVLVTLLVVYLTYLAIARYQSRIEELAVTDKLTGLYNRHAFDILQKRLLARARREAGPLTVLLADIDYFKLVNDRHGHEVGDRVLAAVAGELLAGLRESDVVVRWGGEEFLMVLPDCRPDDALSLAENLRRRVAGMAAAGLPVGGVTLSIGVAAVVAEAESMESALREADQALYAAKAAGRNCVKPAAGA